MIPARLTNSFRWPKKPHSKIYYNWTDPTMIDRKSGFLKKCIFVAYDVLADRLKVPLAKIQNFESYKSQHGPFTSLENMLDVKGVTWKQLQKIFYQIISDPKANSVKLIPVDKKLKKLLNPPALQEGIKTAVGIHTSSAGVSWAKFDLIDRKLQAWGYEHFKDLPKKIFPIDIFNLTKNSILTRLPIGDVYVFEEASFVVKRRESSGVNLMELTQINFMLMALINTSTKHNPTCNVDGNNVVYFLMSNFPDRLFDRTVGQEKTSTNETVSQLLGTISTKLTPCDPIDVNKQFCDDYSTQDSMCKELLEEALLLVLTFIKIFCIKKKKQS